jgi:NAD-dependent SIR2 family protein deacetylase
MKDIFNNTILCEKCDTKMQKAQMKKNGFVFRLVVCPDCGEKVVHPIDEQEYNKFISLKNKEFRVKMRLVGNSYAVSIPKEIVLFMRAQERMMDDMVKLCFEDSGRLSLSFNEINKDMRRK